MNQQVDLVIVGAGPAGMSAAVEARSFGLSVIVMDDQPSPGGQIWRSVEQVGDKPRGKVLGSTYLKGGELCKKFRACGAIYFPGTRVWNIEIGHRVFASREGKAFIVEAPYLIIATGAQERPAPFVGWTLPGVMTVGAAQILLKSADQVPDGKVWVAGSGPLALLYAAQLMKAGGKIAGFLNTSPKPEIASIAPKLLRAALSKPTDLIKGLLWLTSLRARTKYFAGITALEASGEKFLQTLSFTDKDGLRHSVDASTLLIHEGVVPSIHNTQVIDCDHIWDEGQECYIPAHDQWGEVSHKDVFIAGDGARIGGADAACYRGRLSALKVASRAMVLSEVDLRRLSGQIRRKLSTVLSVRPFLDEMYKPRAELKSPPDSAIICRCEEKTASQLRSSSNEALADPNRVKTFTRAGMGPCQGRQCNGSVARLLAEAHGLQVSEIGLHRIRPPLKPLTLDELASLNVSSEQS